MTYSEEEYNAILAVCRSYKNDYDSAFERLKAQQREIDGLRAENARLTEKLKQVLLAVDTVKEMNTMCKIDEQRKRAVQDFAEKIKEKSYVNDYCREVVEVEKIDELLKEYE